jgi:hypothetical protein
MLAVDFCATLVFYMFISTRLTARLPSYLQFFWLSTNETLKEDSERFSAFLFSLTK